MRSSPCSAFSDKPTAEMPSTGSVIPLVAKLFQHRVKNHALIGECVRKNATQAVRKSPRGAFGAPLPLLQRPSLRAAHAANGRRHSACFTTWRSFASPATPSRTTRRSRCDAHTTLALDLPIQLMALAPGRPHPHEWTFVDSSHCVS